VTSKAGKILVAVGVPPALLGAYIIWYAAGRGWFKVEDATHGILIGGAGLILLSIGLAKAVKPLVGALAFVVLGGLAAFVLYRGASKQAAREQGYEDRKAVMEAVFPACEGKAVTGAAARSDAGPRPTVVINISSDGRHYEWAANDTWRPSSLETAQLVACFTTDKQLINSCSYDTSKGPVSVPIYQYVITGKVYEAKTAKLLGEKTFTGSRPSEECAASITFREGSGPGSREGSMPDDKEQLAFVRGFVEDAERP
jgi:hypothetical protein